MRICIYCEPLRVKTSGTPMRNMVKELIALRAQDHFLLAVRKGYEQDGILTTFFESLSGLKNWEIKIESISRKLSNVLGLLHYPSYCQVNTSADIYLNPDCNSLGKKAHPLVVTVADLSSFRPLEQTSYKKPWQLRLRRFMIRNAVEVADGIITISDYTKAELVERFPFTKNKTTTVYNGIDQQWLQQPVVQQESKKRYWIWWGMISGRKNLSNLIRAYAVLKKEIQDLPAILLIYSNAQFPEDLSELIAELDLKNDILQEKSKPLDELIQLVSASQGLLFPSFVEGFGMPVVESLARGIPVLTSNTTSLKEVGGGLAELVDTADIQSIKIGLKKFAASGKQEEKGRERKDWAARFTPVSAAKEFSRILDTLLYK